jgi:hypothetical protein
VTQKHERVSEEQGIELLGSLADTNFLAACDHRVAGFEAVDQRSGFQTVPCIDAVDEVETFKRDAVGSQLARALRIWTPLTEWRLRGLGVDVEVAAIRKCVYL